MFLVVGISTKYFCLYYHIGFYAIFSGKPDLIKNDSYFSLFTRYIYIELKG